MSRTAPVGRLAVALLGLVGALAAALPTTGIALGTGTAATDPAESGDVAVTMLVALLVAIPVLAVGLLVMRRARLRRPVDTLAAVFAVDVAAMTVLAWTIPFRWGVLSCLLYVAPAVLVSAAVLRRSRAAAVAAVAVLAVVVALAAPIRAMQQHIAVREWTRATGIPSRTVAQVVRFPGARQEAYTWDGTTLAAMFSTPDGQFQERWTAVETVRPGYADPCGPVMTTGGDTSHMDTPPCVREAPGLWHRGSATQAAGYVLQRSGVTVTVTEGSWIPGDSDGAAYVAGERAKLRRVALSARTATDRDLWSRAKPGHMTLLGFLLL